MATGLTLLCPIRGQIKATARSKDGLAPSEEAQRIEAIKFLLDRGYPAENIKIEAVVKRFGNSGRNSFRADLAVLDVPVKSIVSGDVETLLDHALILAEIKRDNAKANYVKATQVRPLLDSAKRDDCLAIYWDDTEQRVFWRETVGGKRRAKEGSIDLLPRYGEKINVKPLTFGIISKRPTTSLTKAFGSIEDRLHSAGMNDKSRRYDTMLQLLLAKLFDEHTHELLPDQPLDIQDYDALGMPAKQALDRFNAVLEKAVDRYGRYLPNEIKTTIKVSGETLAEIMAVLATINVLAASASVIQDFYMFFAPTLYKFPLAQYFTPTPVTQFVVDVLNLKPSEHIKDPACGSADFLTAAFRAGRDLDRDYADYLHGADNSENSVQVAVLNMLLHGDGKTHIELEDSLAAVTEYADGFDTLVCNPPFGMKIVERKASTLELYDLGHEWRRNDAGEWEMANRLVEKQEMGILFAELCVKETKPGGRIALILPNGYLGNRNAGYAFFREWLLRHCRMAAVVSMPETAFTQSGAHVSTSIIYLEKRQSPLTSSALDRDYNFAVEIIENLGWDLSKQKAEPLYRRDPNDGTVLLDTDSKPQIEADYDKVLSGIRNSAAVLAFRWLADQPASGGGWSVPISRVLDDPHRTLDPKRWCRKAVELRAAIESRPHVRLGDLVRFIPERRTAAGTETKVKPELSYGYIDIGNIGEGGVFVWDTMRGWALPDRAKHQVEPGDIYAGAIWGGVTKWLYAGGDCSDLIVTNGCARMRLIDEDDDRLLDLIAALCSEAYAVQTRSLARGSNALAEITEEDMAGVLVPLITDPAARAALRPFVANLKVGRQTIRDVLGALNGQGALFPVPRARSHHSVAV